MDIRNVELSIEDILSIHRHWITKLYLDDKKSEVEIVDLLYERRLPVTISQIQGCLTEWDLISSPPTRRGSDTSLLSSLSSEGWDGVRSPSPTSSTTSVYSTPAENVALYSKRPLPSLPATSGSSSRSNSRTASRPSTRSSRHTNNNMYPTRQHQEAERRRFADRSPRDLLRVTCHHTPTRSYEVEMSLGVIPKGGPSPLDLYTSHQEPHERIAIGLKRTECPSPKEPFGKGEEFEWLRQFKALGPRGNRRGVQILQVRDEGDDGDDEHEL